MSQTLTEVFLSGEDQAQSDDGLVWKTILRTGEWKVHPNGKGAPLKFIKEGKTDPTNGVVALSDIKDAFEDQAIEHVTIPLSTRKDTDSHDDLTIDNTGFIKKVKIVDGSDGISRLVAGHQFTEDQVAKKVLNGSIAGNSAGLLFNWTRKSDGKTYPVAMAHSALTNRPWLDNLGPFGIAASDEVDVIETLEPVIVDESEGKKPSEEVPPPYEEKITVPDSGTEEGEKDLEKEDSFVKKIAEGFNKALENFADSWMKKQNTVQKEEHSAGTPAESQDRPLITTPSIPVQKTDAELLREQQQRREAYLSQERTKQSTTNGGNGMTDLSKLELSDEAKRAFEDQQNQLAERDKELARFRAQARKSEVDSRIAELKEMGLEQHPGLLKVIQEIYLSDDGGTALLLSQEGEDEKKKFSASQIVDRLLDALPKKDEKIALSTQVVEPDKDKKPPVDTDDELPLEERLEGARKFLGLEEPKGVTK